MSYGLDLSPAQAPFNCFGCTQIISRDRLSSRIMARLRPRHFRKIEYNDRLRDGDAHMTEAWEVFQGCQHTLSHEKRQEIQGHLNGLRLEREKLFKFSDYRGAQIAETDAISRAETFRTNASRVRTMAAQARKNSQVSVAAPRSHTHSASLHSATPASRRVSSERAHTSIRHSPASLSRVSSRNHEPLEMIQTRAGPISWTPSPPHNALQLQLGDRASPRPPTLMSTGTPRTPGSMLSLNMPLAQFSPVNMSPVSGHGYSPTDSLAYSLGSDGFPRPSRRPAERRSTIQTTTSMSRSSASRKSTQTQSRSGSSHYRRSLENSARRSGSLNSQQHRSPSQEGYGQRPYTRTPTSLRNSSTPPMHGSYPGTPSH